MSTDRGFQLDEIAAGVVVDEISSLVDNSS